MEWDYSERGRDLYGIQKVVNGGLKLKSNLNRRDEVLLHQIRLGKCKLNYYKFLINNHESGLCDICMKNETVEHFIIQCKKYENERKVLQRKLKLITDSLNLANVFKESENDNYMALTSYIRNTKRFSEDD